MAQLSNVLRSVEGGGLVFRCPGCKGNHMVRVGAGEGPRWTFDGNVERPTFSPSVLVTAVEDLDEDEIAQGVEPINVRCHSFVTAGRIHFLGDCTHELANCTVDMVALD